MSTSPASSEVDQAIKEFGADFGGRIKGCQVAKGFVIGNVARPFSKKRENKHTHAWTVFLKPYRNEDYSKFIKMVEFKLHDSYEEPRRVITKPPYEIKETGWGEFEIPIKIHFMDPTEKPVTVHHSLKLFYKTNGNESQALQITVKKNSVVAESYDEIVFNEPTRYMKSLLDNLVPITEGAYKHETDFEAKFQESKNNIEAAKAKVKAEIEELRNRLQLSRDTVFQFNLQLEDARLKAPPKKKTSGFKKLDNGNSSTKKGQDKK